MLFTTMVYAKVCDKSFVLCCQNFDGTEGKNSASTISVIGIGGPPHCASTLCCSGYSTESDIATGCEVADIS